MQQTTGPLIALRRTLASLGACVSFVSGAQGFELALEFPGTADLVATTETAMGMHAFATGSFSGEAVPTRMSDGRVLEYTWQITGADVGTAALVTVLRSQMESQGFEVGFSCAAAQCGGFDFRHALSVGTAPEMHVDLGDYHYLTATASGAEGAQQAALMVSRGGATGFVHLTLVQPASAATVTAPITTSSRSPEVTEDTDPDTPTLTLTPPPATDLVSQLIDMGAAPLDDLRFETGASTLSGNDYASLGALARFLNADGSRRIVLVGHTDAMGSLAGNIALSEDRARAVRQFLIQQLGVNPAQVRATGIGFLAPRASNTTAEGRETNRRVEVVLEASE